MTIVQKSVIWNSARFFDCCIINFFVARIKSKYL